jgi:ubiquinone/menaquinone biosynthesis C-methylase UbiE
MGWGTGDGETLAALCERARLVVAIDSGPLHVAMATATPVVACWVGHHPVHYADLSGNTVHLIPSVHRDLIRGDRAVGLRFFEDHYRYAVYSSLDVELLRHVTNELGLQALPETPMKDSRLLTATAYDQSYYDQHKAAGLDYLDFGTWHSDYGEWLVESFGIKGRHVLDIGGACGSIAWGIRGAGCHVQMIELNEYMATLGRAKYRGMPIYVCDSCNMHYFADATFDFLRSNQVFEHFRPELVPFILRECRRVLRPGGLMFAAFDSAEQYKQQGRNPQTEDKTHLCVKPIAFWHDQLAEAGFEDVRIDYEPRMRGHPKSFLIRYEWPFIAVRKPLPAPAR